MFNSFDSSNRGSLVFLNLFNLIWLLVSSVFNALSQTKSSSFFLSPFCGTIILVFNNSSNISLFSLSFMIISSGKILDFKS